MMTSPPSASSLQMALSLHEKHITVLVLPRKIASIGALYFFVEQENIMKIKE